MVGVQAVDALYCYCLGRHSMNDQSGGNLKQPRWSRSAVEADDACRNQARSSCCYEGIGDRGIGVYTSFHVAYMHASDLSDIVSF